MSRFVVRSNQDGEKFISYGGIEINFPKSLFVLYDAVTGYFQSTAGPAPLLSPFPLFVKCKAHGDMYVLVDEWMLPIINLYYRTYNAATEYIQCVLKSASHSSPITLQRVVLPTFPWLDVDHIDNNKNNYTSANLRAILHADNIRKQKNHKSHAGKPTSSKFRGVSWNKKLRKWYATIVVERVQLYLGNHTNPHLAAAVYNFFAERLFREYAELNPTCVTDDELAKANIAELRTRAVTKLFNKGKYDMAVRLSEKP